MEAHLIEAGPAAIRRLCCGGVTVADHQVERAALDGIDDPLALVGLRPVTVASLWRQALASVDCGSARGVTVVHPSWWSSARVEVIRSAAEALTGDPQTRSRSWLLRQAARAGAAAVVEITADFVVTTGEAVAVERRNRDVETVAEAVAESISTMTCGASAAVVIDAAAVVPDAGRVAGAIAAALRRNGLTDVVVVDDARLKRIVGQLQSSVESLSASARRRSLRSARRVAAASASVAAALLGVEVRHRHPAPRESSFSTTFIVEGHVAVEVPAGWPTRRIVAGPGSARVQITSPTDPDVALHVTQSRVALPGLDATADFLKTAIDAAPVGVFVDFNPRDHRAGRPVVTYREIRAGHEIRWTVWVDALVRISIGCQNPSDRPYAVSRECELAIRTARALT